MNNYIDKIAIAIPPVGTGKSFVGTALPPLGTSRMATMLKSRFPDISIEVYDGVLIGQEELEKRVKGLSPNSVLGISAHTSLNYNNCLKLLDYSPTRNIIFGGIHVEGKRCGKLAVQRRGFDVIQGQGEISLIQYIEYLQKKRSKHEVNGLIYLENGKVMENPKIIYPQASFSFPIYEDFFPIKKYAKTYKNYFKNGDIGLTMISPEGCKWQSSNQKNRNYCSFCDIGTKFKLHDPKFFGKLIQESVNRYKKFGKVFLVDYADEASGAGIKWWSKALENIPSTIKPHQDYGIKIYAKSGKGFFDSDDLAKILQNIGVEDIHVGFEAATDEDLKSFHKGSSMKDHYKLIELAKKYDFRVVAAFVLGAPTSTQSSLEECIKFSKHIEDNLEDKLIVVTGSPVMPLPGAPMWEMLKEKAYKKQQFTELFETDNPDLYLARKLWYKWFCKNLSAECGGADNAIKYAKKIGSKLNKIGSLSTPENEFG